MEIRIESDRGHIRATAIKQIGGKVFACRHWFDPSAPVCEVIAQFSRMAEAAFARIEHPAAFQMGNVCNDR